MHAPLSSFEFELALAHMPAIVLLTFNRLKQATVRSNDLWASVLSGKPVEGQTAPRS